MTQAFICDAIRTPFGRYGGALSSVRTDDHGAVPIAALMARNLKVDWAAVSDVIYGCANQAGEDNRNVARTVAMLINEAADAVLQGVCTPEGANAAMKLGVNYPAGPFEWLAGWNESDVADLIDTLDHHYRGERYRVSPWLRRRSLIPKLTIKETQ